MLILRSMLIVRIGMPGSVLDGHSFPADVARKLIDWWLDTGGDEKLLPPGYKAIRPCTLPPHRGS